MKLRSLAYIFLALLVFITLLIGNVSSSADEPASEGRPITPAGSLVQDLTTRHAAVGALTVDFVRRPDKSGPDGAGRFLLAVKSGYRVQFHATAKPGQTAPSGFGPDRE